MSRLENVLPLQTTPPKVAVVSNESAYFRLNCVNNSMLTIEEFLKPLKDIGSIAQAFDPDFYVMLLSPAMLHDDAAPIFSDTILQLLEKKMSVHLRLVPLRDLGLPQSRSILVVMASPFCDNLSNTGRHATDGQRLDVVELLQDLSLENPRTIQGGDVGFVCSLPGQPGYIFNHNTGQRPPGDNPDATEFELNLDLHLGPKLWIHPGKSARSYR